MPSLVIPTPTYDPSLIWKLHWTLLDLDLNFDEDQDVTGKIIIFNAVKFLNGE